MKPLRAFPFPLNIGTDICRISRIYTILQGPRARRFAERVLAPEEHGQLSRFAPLGVASAKIGDVKEKPPALADAEERDPSGWKRAAFIAGRFAAKEAAIKAHSHRRLTFHDVVIEKRAQAAGTSFLGSGPPVARIKAATGGEEEDVSAMVSISHDGDYATAVCLAHDPSVAGP